MTCEPVGAIEIADRLGVKPAAVYNWNYKGLLPAPDWVVGGRPAWNWSTIRDWAKATGRFTGRPR
jgi:hypothetical protein